jgi:8-oxo-dGTP pyrophosphatase MutT (NUDIX family)
VPPGAKLNYAAVLLALHPDATGKRISFPLVCRPESMPRHAGQVGLPGGALHKGEDARSCALREAWEEVGIEPATVDIVGRLTPVVIPLSRYHVDIMVGWIPERPSLRRQEGEVLRIIHGDPDRMAREGMTRWVAHERSGKVQSFPAFLVEDEIVWGATALMLAEFLMLWRGIRGIPHPPAPPANTGK